jgi:hypothetical protein
MEAMACHEALALVASMPVGAIMVATHCLEVI